MSNPRRFEYPIQRAVRMAAERGMFVHVFVTSYGKMIHHIEGYNLTTEQVLHLDSTNQLTIEGIRSFAVGFEEALKRTA
jgi:hypothetical protein